MTHMDEEFCLEKMFCRKLESKYNFEKFLKWWGREEDGLPFHRLLNLHPTIDIPEIFSGPCPLVKSGNTFSATVSQDQWSSA